jgi:hypothetical protein
VNLSNLQGVDLGILILSMTWLIIFYLFEMLECKHRVVAERFVAFDGCWTRRRFLGCVGQDGEAACDFHLWVDNE